MKKIILDFSNRLPGPLATHLLTHYDFEVIKIENSENPDPFSKEIIPGDSSFQKWYQSLQTGKKILRLNFSLEKEKIWELVRQAHGILAPLHGKWKEELGLTKDKLKFYRVAFIEIAASRSQKPMHDLNAFSQSSLVKRFFEK